MIQQCKDNLAEIKILLQHLKQESYAQSIELFSGSSIGQHVRHVLEFYLCLLEGIPIQKINYDLRKRSLELETNIPFAIETIDAICNQLETIKDGRINLEGIYSSPEGNSELIQSSLYRELAFCFEHSIHHQAFIKIGLRELNLINLVSANFGVNPTTIKHKEKCAQ